MTDLTKQIVTIIFGAILSALVGMGVSALQKISDDVAHLDQSVAVIVTQIGEHDRRLRILERAQRKK